MQLVRVENYNICPLARLERTNLVLHMQATGTVDGCKRENITCRQSLWAAAGLMNERGFPHLSKHIKCVAARRAVCTKAKEDTLSPKLRDPTEAGSQL